MLQEERDPIGLWRHFWTKAQWTDLIDLSPAAGAAGAIDAAVLAPVAPGRDAGFYYSADFQSFFCRPELPKVHGGLLCEEMGLGKVLYYGLL
jgi:hypothetical protein